MIGRVERRDRAVLRAVARVAPRPGLVPPRAAGWLGRRPGVATRRRAVRWRSGGRRACPLNGEFHAGPGAARRRRRRDARRRAGERRGDRRDRPPAAGAPGRRRARRPAGRPDPRPARPPHPPHGARRGRALAVVGPPYVADTDQFAAAARAAHRTLARASGCGRSATTSPSPARSTAGASTPFVAERPVRVQHRSGGAWILNSAALALTGIDERGRPPGHRARRRGSPHGPAARPRPVAARPAPAAPPPDLAAVGRRLAVVRRHRGHRPHAGGPARTTSTRSRPRPPTARSPST